MLPQNVRKILLSAFKPKCKLLFKKKYHFIQKCRSESKNKAYKPNAHLSDILIQL